MRLQLKYRLPRSLTSPWPAAPVNRIVFQFAAEEVADDSGEHHRQQRDRNTDGQQRQIANAQRFKDTSEKTTAAEMGEAVIAIWEATTAIDSGRDGRMPCSLATSVITGSVEKAVWPVPASTVINQSPAGQGR